MTETTPETKMPQAQTVTTSPAVAKLRAQGLMKKYGGKKVVDGVDFLLNPGEIVALLGPNGAGKTTSFYMMVGFVRPNAGRIYLGDQEVTNWAMHKRARAGLGYLAQEPSAFRKMSVIDNLLAVLEFQNLTKAERTDQARRLLDEFGLLRLADHRADTLSGGERRRLRDRPQPHHRPRLYPAGRTLHRGRPQVDS